VLRIVVLLLTSAAMAADTSAVYQRDSHSLVNRVYLAVATRTMDGVRYGVDIAEPFFQPTRLPGRYSYLLV
jgi:hypothetical protein